MKIYDLTQGSTILIELKGSNSKELLKGKVLNKKENKKIILINIPQLGLNKEKIKLTYISNNGLKVWDDLVLNSMEGYPFNYIIMSDLESKNINRRNSYRLDIFKPAKITIHVKGIKDDKILDVTLKDLSTLGFCFFIKDELTDDLRNAELKHLSFDDGEFNLNLNFSIVREVEVEGIYFYGCKFKEVPRGGKLDKYLYQEQMKYLRAKRQKQ